MRRHPAPTFVFADLVGYTALTETRGNETAAGVAREFRRSMSSLSRDHGAFTVKSMGDAVMIWAPDAGEAVALAADETLVSAATRRAARATDDPRLHGRRELSLRGVERPRAVLTLT